jgi:RNA polymerase sigma-70 factor (ECF subfamily)
MLTLANNTPLGDAARDDSATIAAILSGNSHLFHDLIRPYERSVYMVALSMLKEPADAEDVAQEAFLKAFCGLSTFRAESKFSTWLISITINEARSRLRKQKASRTESLDDDGDDHVTVSPAALTDWREIPSEALERQEVRLLLREAVTELPSTARYLFCEISKS